MSKYYIKTNLGDRFKCSVEETTGNGTYAQKVNAMIEGHPDLKTISLFKGETLIAFRLFHFIIRYDDQIKIKWDFTIGKT